MTDPALNVFGICRANGVDVTAAQEEKLRRYVELLLEWNTKLNLISRRDVENVWTSHILHSLSLLFLVGIPIGARILDLGTGGGLPGVPIALVRPDLRITLLDSIRKKGVVLGQMTGVLDLANVEVVTGRAEVFGEHIQHGGGFDIVVARAVAPLVDLIRWSRPLMRRGEGSGMVVRGGGRGAYRVPYLLALKGGDVEAEVALAKTRAGIGSIVVRELVFEGSIELGLEGKKLVVVEL